MVSMVIPVFIGEELPIQRMKPLEGYELGNIFQSLCSVSVRAAGCVSGVSKSHGNCDVKHV